MTTQKTVALIGNQNSGKTTLFNALTGANQYVGNWPGVTVDRVVGRVSEKDLAIVDLPGLYSLSPYSAEEVVSRDYLTSGEYDVIVNVVDATHLERGLSLTAEVLAMGRKTVVALNMMDLAAEQKITIDEKELAKRLGCEVIPVCAANGKGLELLLKAIEEAKEPAPLKVYPEVMEEAITHIADMLEGDSKGVLRFVAASLLQRDKLYSRRFDSEDLQIALTTERAKIERELGDDTESLMATYRYNFVDALVKACVKKTPGLGRRFSMKVDDIVTNRFLGIPIFLVVVYCVYYLAVSTIGTMATDYANDVVFGEWCTNAAAAALENSPEWLQGLVIDGVIGGVGAVLGFVPQMIVFFLLLAFLEQCGYMTRVAFVLDRIFRHFGLSGRCFIPMVVASGCGVPALMSAKSIDNINERRITLITTTFVPCSAKLPILAMIAAAFFPESTFVAPGVYLLAIISIFVTAFILKKQAAFREDVSPFVLELPDYHMPKISNVLRTTYERCMHFIKKAGTIIFTTVVLVWFLSSFGFGEEGFGMVDVGDSMLAAIGTAIAFIFAPLGFASWQCAVAIFTGLLAKENVVGTLAVLLGLGEVAEDDASLGMALHGEFTTDAAALAFLTFNLFSTPCIAALGAMKKQLASGKMFAFACVYMLVWAYALALIIYQLGGLFAGQVDFGMGTVFALLILAAIIALVVRPEKARADLKIAVRKV